MFDKSVIKKGIKDGIPIALGYFAVAFSLGIVASNAGLTPFEGFITSALVNASAGENAGFLAIKEAVPYIEMVLITIVANARYILMSASLSQHISPNTRFIHRILLGFYVTDEYFALGIKDEYLNPYDTCNQVSLFEFYDQKQYLHEHINFYNLKVILCTSLMFQHLNCNN